MDKVIYMPMKKKSGIKKIWIMLIFILGIIFFLISCWLVSSKTVKTVFLEWHSIQIDFPVEIVFIREERAVKAPIKGYVVRQDINDGERVRVGQTVATINAKSIDGQSHHFSVVSEWAGTLSFAVDGFEETFNGKGIRDFNLAEIKKLNFERSKSEGELVEKGEALFKIIDSFRDVNFIMYFPHKHLLANVIDPQLLLEGPLLIFSEEKHYGVQVTDINYAGEDVYCFGKILEAPEDFFNVRKGKYMLMVREYEGYLVDNSALTMLDDVPGVYYQVSNNYEWTPVEIIYQNSNKTLIRFDKEKHPVVINPEVFH
ncbi:MAG: HlyD family efflux transporter periplasmic adaptor subunit [Bacillota bacterium]